MPASIYAKRLEQKLGSLAPTSGCYLFKDGGGRVVYVGKAKSLRSRVRSYFSRAGSDGRNLLPLLLRAVADVETVVTDTEKEAAILENELIKQHQPRFNVKLRDDKDFLCLKLDLRQLWPRLEPVRRPKADGARYFGPYHSATAARRMLRLVGKHFQLRTCSNAELGARKRPCLQYQIKRCPAPCVLAVEPEHYAEQVRAVVLFLDGRHDELSGELRRRMQRAAQNLEYELAAMYRDQLRAVESTRQAQRIVHVGRVDQDVVGLWQEAGMSEVVLMLVRRGRVVETRSFSLGSSELPADEAVSGFLAQYYGDGGRAGPLPDEIVVPLRPDAAGGIEQWLSERRGSRVRLVAPKSGVRAKLLELAADNAAHAFVEKQRAKDEIQARLEELQKKLRLPTVPRLVECCDISHLGGGDAVGAIAVLREGQLERQGYRSFKVKTTRTGDDYAAMYEVLARRFRRGRDEASGWELPDLMVVDGGRGQLGVALAAAGDLGLHDLVVVGLAKERTSQSGAELVDRVYLPGQKNPIALRPGSASLYFLAQVRDEAHRFANRGRKKRGKKRRLRSELEDIRGIGPVARKALLRELGSVRAIRRASDEQILAVPRVTRAHLRALRRVMAAPEGDEGGQVS